MDESKIFTGSTKSFLDCVIGPPHSLNDQWGESFISKKEERTTSNCTGKGSSAVHNLVVDYRVKVGDHSKVNEENVVKGVVLLLVSFTSYAHAFMGRIKSKDEVQKYLEICFGHTAAVT